MDLLKKISEIKKEEETARKNFERYKDRSILSALAAFGSVYLLESAGISLPLLLGGFALYNFLKYDESNNRSEQLRRNYPYYFGGRKN